MTKPKIVPVTFLLPVADRQLLDARWFWLLGLDRSHVVDLLAAARRDGALDFRMQADVVEIDLPPLEAA